MSLKTFVSRAFAVQSCVVAAVASSFACNALFGGYMIGYNPASTLLVGSIIGILIAAAIGLTDFVTYYAGRTRDFLMCNSMGVVAAITVYHMNVILHMNTSGQVSVRGYAIAIALGLICGNTYAAACGAVKKLA